MNTATGIGGEPLDALARFLDFMCARDKPSGWHDVSATLPRDVGDPMVQALDVIAAEVRTDPEPRTPETLRAVAFVEFVLRISGETRHGHTA